MTALIRRLLKDERGVGMAMVLGFMGLSVPMIVAALGMAGTYSNDSQVKSRLAKSQYSSIGAFEYIRYLSDDPERFDDWLAQTGGEEEIEVDGQVVNIKANQDGFDDGFLAFCIFGRNSVVVKQNTTANCSIGSNGDVEIEAASQEDAKVYGDIHSGGNVLLGENSLVEGNVKAAGTVTLLPGATVLGTIQQGLGDSFEIIAGPAPLYDVIITVTDLEGNVTQDYTSVTGEELPMTFDLEGGGANVTVQAGQTHDLDPGSYGIVEVKENAILNLRSLPDDNNSETNENKYAFLEFTIKEGATINVDVTNSAVVFDAVDLLEFKEDIAMNVTGGTAADFVVRVQNQAQFKRDGQYLGTYFGFEASLAQMHVKENSTLTGALYGDTVEVKENSVVNGMPATAAYLSFFGD